MQQHPDNKPNIQQAVPFFMVNDMKVSLKFYVEGLGFDMTNSWIDEGKLRWCLLQQGGAALMLQEYRKEGRQASKPEGTPGIGVSVYFICGDSLAIYREITSRGILASEPFVGNQMWVTEVSDPDGYRLAFESYTDVPEETKLSEWNGQ